VPIILVVHVLEADVAQSV